MSADVVLRKANEADLLEVAQNARQADIDEVQAAMGMDLAPALIESYRLSDWAKVGFADGKLLAAFGVASKNHLGVVGVPWMIGTTHLPKAAKTFIKHSRPVVEEMHYNYPVLSNYVDARNKLAIRWLRWLGFKMVKLVPCGPWNYPFWHFTRINHV